MRIAVIGGGPAGCAAAFTLRSARHSVVVFEQHAQIGGRTESVRYPDGVIVDSGAGFFTQYYPVLRRLVRAVGLASDVVELSRTAGLTRDGRLQKLALGSVRSFARFSHARTADKLRVAALIASQYARRWSVDLAAPEALVRHDDRSLAMVEQRIGSHAFQVFIRPSIEPFWYTACADVSLALGLALHARFATTRFYTLRNGMDTLCRALVDDCERRTGTKVIAIRDAAARGLDVEATSGGGAAAERFDRVVIATTADAAATMTRALPPACVAPEQRAFLETVRYAPNVHLTYLAPQVPGLSDLSLVSACEPRRHPIAAVGFHGQKYPGAAFHERGDEIVSVYSADFAFEQLRSSGAAAAETAWALAREVCPALPPRARLVHTAVRELAVPIHAVGRYRAAAAFLARQRPPVVFAGDYLATATIEGALRSGVRAAGAVTAP
jgi:protoporphyrinogen/coproporphyrinogen III oxidase